MRIGTAMSRVFTPVARVLNAPCVDSTTGNLRQDSTCAKVRDHLDAGRWKEAAYDFIWRNKTEELTMDEPETQLKNYIVVHQIGVVASSAKAALAAMDSGETMSLTVQLRNQQPGQRNVPDTSGTKPDNSSGKTKHQSGAVT